MPRYPVFAALVLLLSWIASDLRAAAAVESPATPALTALEMRAPKEGATSEEMAAFTADVGRLVESNTLKTGTDFFSAANLAMFGIAGEFRRNKVSYELLLVAAAKDYVLPGNMLAQGWDGLLLAVGRPLRMEFSGILPDREARETYGFEAAPAVIQAVWRDPAKARSLAKEAKNNDEMQALVDADQEVRGRDWSKLTEAERRAVHDGDRSRNVRTRAIVKAGDLRTADDFANASLVMQHSPTFAGYQLAHELAVCSMLLGDRKTGRWLVAATYDRMLNSIGHDQRFGTQYMNDMLVEIDERGICDEERLALGCRGLNGTLGDTLVRKAEGLVAQKKFAEAEPVAREAVARRSAGYPAEAWQIFSAQRVLGASLLGQKKFADAEPILLEAYRGLKAKESAISATYRVRIKDTAQYLAELYQALDRPEKAREWKQRVEEFEREHPSEK